MRQNPWTARPNRCRQRLQESLPVLVIAIDSLALVAASGEVIDGVGVFHTDRPCHVTRQPTRNHTLCQESRVDPYSAQTPIPPTLVMNQVFTFDRDGKFVRYKNVEGFPEKQEESKKVDTSTKQGMVELVEDFFLHNFRDVTSRKTQEWGEPQKQPDGNVSIRYRYEARIWDKETKIMNQVFTFTPQGKFVSVKAVEGFPKDA